MPSKGLACGGYSANVGVNGKHGVKDTESTLEMMRPYLQSMKQPILNDQVDDKS